MNLPHNGGFIHQMIDEVIYEKGHEHHSARAKTVE